MGYWNLIDLIQFRFLSPPELTTFSFPRARVALITFPRVLVHRFFRGFLSIHPSEFAMHRSDANSSPCNHRDTRAVVHAATILFTSSSPCSSLRHAFLYTIHPTIVIPQQTLMLVPPTASAARLTLVQTSDLRDFQPLGLRHWHIHTSSHVSERPGRTPIGQVIPPLDGIHLARASCGIKLALCRLYGPCVSRGTAGIRPRSAATRD